MNRIIRKLAIVLLFLGATIITANSQKGNSSAPFFFIQVTDPQLGMFEENRSFEKETELFEKAVKEINRLNPDFVVITGDLVNDKNNRSQVEEFKRIKRLIKADIPVYLSPGNHDIGMPSSEKDIDQYMSDYGSDRFSFRHKKSLFIGINSVLIKGDAPEPEQKQLAWLKKELSKGKRAEHIIIFTHYPFFINTEDEKETYSNIAIKKREMYINLFSKYKVGAVFAGHLHNNGKGKAGAMEMITTSAVGKPLGKAPSGMRIIKVYTNRIETSYAGLDENPLTISFY